MCIEGGCDGWRYGLAWIDSMPASSDHHVTCLERQFFQYASMIHFKHTHTPTQAEAAFANHQVARLANDVGHV